MKILSSVVLVDLDRFLDLFLKIWLFKNILNIVKVISLFVFFIRSLELIFVILIDLGDEGFLRVLLVRIVWCIRLSWFVFFNCIIVYLRFFCCVLGKSLVIVFILVIILLLFLFIFDFLVVIGEMILGMWIWFL